MGGGNQRGLEQATGARARGGAGSSAAHHPETHAEIPGRPRK
jgi:hypothetical protein